MSSAVQTSLFDLGGELGDEQGVLGQLDGMVTRHVLGRGAWVDHLPGWVAGLRLTAVSMSSGIDHSSFLSTFENEGRQYILDYLLDEVLLNLKP